ncbi:40S ribosomal protein S13-like [Durio zibethinus]|uniref:40S ribosomal protein S13-like n=1 Tax=Durio zibethinus TaxID=66656 RepID=A0A6P5YAY3_DURZI|nr:40S ribosomal protein S13-like [Durio zibethinus]
MSQIIATKRNCVCKAIYFHAKAFLLTVNLGHFFVVTEKGVSASALPYRRTPSTWLKISPQDFRWRKKNICKFAKKVLTPSQIGLLIGVALAPEIPEDLYHLIKKAMAIRKHLERNRKDKDSKFRLILVESRIQRLARYYKTKKLPPVWKYDSTTASTLVA